VAQANEELTVFLLRKEEQEVLAYITINPQGILIREHTTTQFHPLLGRIRRRMGWMDYKEE
jgi:hypothetical protein